MTSTQKVHAERILCRPGIEPALAGGSIEIQDGYVTRVAEDGRASNGRIALPALSDAHDHGRGQRSLAYGAIDAPLELWLPRLGLEPLVDPYLRAAVAFGRLARSGVAAANHCHNPQDHDRLVDEARAVSQASADIGIRIAFSVPVFDRNEVVYGDPAPLRALIGDDRFETLEKRLKRPPTDIQLARVEEIMQFEHHLFSVQFGPFAPQWCKDETLERIADRSRALDRRVHMHFLETPRQREWADHMYPDGIVRHMDSLGLLSDRLTLAHGVWLRQDECELLAERGVTVSVNTSSNLRLRSGLASVARFKAAGLSWALGLDGMAFDDDEDAFRELRLLWHIQQGSGLQGALNAGELFGAACRQGWKSVTSRDEGGRIEPGAAADIVVLDGTKMSADVTSDLLDPVDLILTRATRSHVRELWVVGRRIVEDGQLTTVDLDSMQQELLRQARAGTKDGLLADKAFREQLAAIEAYYGAGHHCSH